MAICMWFIPSHGDLETAPIMSPFPIYEKYGTFIVYTVQPAKSDSGVMFCLQSYQDLESIDHLCINPQDRINTQVIYRFVYAQVKCTR